jgi:hypothetical protein
MENTQHNQALELTAQELAQVSGGVVGGPIPVEGEFAITGGVNTPETPSNDINIGGFIDQKKQEYSEKYDYSFPPSNKPNY